MRLFLPEIRELRSDLRDAPVGPFTYFVQFLSAGNTPISIVIHKAYSFGESGKLFSSSGSGKGAKMQEKYTYGLWGAAGGAVALAVIGFTWGNWYTAKGAAQLAEAAVLTSMVPACAKEVMADPTSAAELLVKRKTDFDDVVRDYRKRDTSLRDLGYQFNRDCGKAIEAMMAKTVTKS